MAIRVSRRKLAAYVADAVMGGASTAQALQPVAAYLVACGRTREQELLVRDIEDALAARGLVIADVVSAHELTGNVEQQIAQLIDASAVQLRATVDPTLLGGVRIDAAGRRFDGTIRRKLTALKAQQL